MEKGREEKMEKGREGERGGGGTITKIDTGFATCSFARG